MTLLRGLRTISGELSGALGDLGTFLPYVVAILGAGVLLPGMVFAGFALAYALAALAYRMPMPVQPMKAIGALAIAGGMGAGDIMISGMIIGAVLLVFAASPRLDGLARAIPQSVVVGLQAGLGLMMGWIALDLMAGQWGIAVLALAVLALSFVAPRGPWVPLVLVAAVLLAPGGVGAGLLAISGPAAPGASAVVAGVTAQLPLTLLNAIVVTAAVARSLYPGNAARVSERRLAATSGALNLFLVPFGALPMCHGAGGLAAHYRFGARGMIAPLFLALLCGLSALAGEAVLGWLVRIPAPVIGALLLYAAIELTWSRRLRDARPDCRLVIGAAALATLFLGALAGLVAGLAAEALRVYLRGRRSDV